MLDDRATCYRHPATGAAVACQRCERPICPQCMTQASVGFHCPECLRTGSQRVIRGSDLRPTNRPPAVVLGLIIINVLAFLGQEVIVDGVSIVRRGLLFGPSVVDGEWWRVVTSGFLHSGLLHLGFNMYALWLFGPPLERSLGSVRFALVYLAGLLGGGAAVLLFNFGAPTLGASGAVLGLAGALTAVLWSRGINITQTSLGGILILNLALPLLVPRISFWGHLGGIAAGFAAGWLLSFLPGKLRWSDSQAVAAAAGLCVALAVVALAVPPI